MKTVLLTGANGFIGRHTIQPLIDKGYDIHCISRSILPEMGDETMHVSWHQADLLNNSDINMIMKSIAPDYLVHLAWNVTPPTYQESMANFDWLSSSIGLLREFAQSGGRKAVFAGTCFEYDVRYGYCIENLTPTAPTTYYGVCKHHLQSITHKFSEKMNLDLAWGRIFNPYGPYEYQTRLAPSIIRALLHGQSALCTHGNQIRDFLHVADVGNAFVKILDSPIIGIINIGSGKPVSIKEFVMQIAQHLGKEDFVQLGALPERENDPPFLVADNTRLKHEAQWSQKFSLEKGIENTILWWEKNEFNENDKLSIGEHNG